MKIEFINKSSLPHSQAQVIVDALQIQVSRDFAPEWRTDATLILAPQSQAKPTPGLWTIAFLDNADTSGALGYHDLTADGLPLGKIFVRTTLSNGGLVSVTASHELLEMLCFTGDTLIPLLNGTEVPIRDLVGKDEFWVYSCKENGELRPGRGHSAKLTRKSAEILRVTLDGGASIRCTPNHLFMLRDGSYCEARDLTPGNSLMPLYRRLEPLGKTNKLYEQTYQPSDDAWRFTHRMVAPYCPSGSVRHHRDFNRFNNSPDNLQILLWDAHRALHAAHIRQHVREFISSGRKRVYSEESKATLRENGRRNLMAYNVSQKHLDDMARYYIPEQRAKVGDRLGRWSRSPENIERLVGIATSQEARDRASKNITAYNKSEEHREVARELGRKMFLGFRSNPIMASKMAEMGSRNMSKLHQDPDFQSRRDARSRETCHKRWHEARGIVNPSCSLCVGIVNHKVSSVEPDGREDVYDFTVDKYHNFALSSGVFVHNCDPDINLSAELDDASGGPSKFVGEEVGDPVEDDSLGYKINGVTVSDFVYRAYFESFRAPNSTKFDHQGKVSRPFEILPGGYLGVFDLANISQGWQQVTADKATNMKSRAPVGSRRERRSIPRSKWQLSDYKEE